MGCASDISTYTPYITGFGGVIAGAISSYFVGVKLAQRNHDRAIDLLKRQEFIRAADTFRAAFVEVVYTLRRGVKYGEKRPQNILTEPVFAEHEKAKIIFEAFLLSGSDLSDFNKAWDNYREYQNRYCEDESIKLTTSAEMCQYCLLHIDALLKFAEPKINI